MQKRVRGSKKRKLLCCVLITVLVFIAYSFLGPDTTDDVYENKEVVQAISEDLPVSPAYKLDPIQCFSLNCRGKHNMLAYKKNKDSSASALSEEGISILERLFADDYDSDTFSDILSKAEEKFLDAIQISGTYNRVFANLAIIKYAQGKEDVALEYINQAIAIKKNVPSYYAIRALLKENNQEEYLADLKNAQILDPMISKGRYFGILMSNDTRTKHHKAFPLVRSLDLEVEKKIMAKYLLWLEFGPFSLLEQAKITRELTQSFIEKRYLVIKQILPKFLQEATKKCYMEYSERNLFINGDMQSPHREVMYNDRCGRFLHFALTDTVRAITHNNVIPTYTYASLYSPGASIGPHVDRQQCEFTLSLCHLQIPAKEPWAIEFGKKPLFDKDPSRGASITEKMPPKDEIISVGLEEGDGLLLMGRHLVHLRDQTLPEGHRTHNTFLHYVASDFTGSLD